MVLENWKHPLTFHTKVTSKWIKYPNLRLDATKLLEENIGRTHFDINCSSIFLDPPKLKNFCTAKKTMNKMKRQPTEWEKMLANDAIDKGLIFKIHR